MGDGPRLQLPLFLGTPQWEQRKKGFFWGKKKAHKRNMIVKSQQLAGSQTVNPKASFCMCTFKLTELQLD